jgi:5-methylcytosine-specific restriction endonuclease McrA
MKQKIPKAVREQVWLQKLGKKYETKCWTQWCENRITVFDFHCGHDVPESRGGVTSIENLVPICARCNLSMSDTYTFTEWNKLSKKPCFPFAEFLWKGWQKPK